MPKQNITFLAFNIFQEIRKYHLPKQEALWLYCQTLQNNPKQTIRYIAQIIGITTYSLPGVKYGGFHYKRFEENKVNALKKSKGSFDAKMLLSKKV